MKVHILSLLLIFTLTSCSHISSSNSGFFDGAHSAQAGQAAQDASFFSNQAASDAANAASQHMHMSMPMGMP